LRPPRKIRHHRRQSRNIFILKVTCTCACFQRHFTAMWLHSACLQIYVNNRYTVTLQYMVGRYGALQIETMYVTRFRYNFYIIAHPKKSLGREGCLKWSYNCRRILYKGTHRFLECLLFERFPFATVQCNPKAVSIANTVRRLVGHG
jgi:hypothetical protein